ncbi:MAG: RluA family pseudouridine synthase [Dehalococcoidia bacterium]|nr:RluA family pseudouridine synthase [Dehalococcoidia bacterium]
MSDIRIFVCENPGERLDRFLADRCAELSRTRIKRIIADGEVTVDGSVQNAGFRLRSGQRVAIVVPDLTPTHMLPQQIPLDVVYDDDELLVVDKPAGMPVHPGVGHPDSTLVNAVLGLDPAIGDVGGTMRPGLVHRLDMDTSGLIAIAKTDRAHSSITGQLRDRTVNKGYLALVTGTLSPSEAVIDAPIGRDPQNRKKMAIVEDGRPASTLYRTIANYRGCSYADVRPRTGRTHQIRVHFASIGHPVVGDALYGRADPQIGRHFLHAAYLEFDHPASGERVHFHSSLPEELQSLKDSLES